MKKLLIKTFLILSLLIALNSASFTQTPTSSTAPTGAVKTDETISFLLTQNENAREVITRQEKRITDLETEVAAEKENSASVGKSYESAKSEIASLKQSNEALSRAVSINEQTIELLKTDNAKQRDKAKKATRAKWKAYAVTGGLILLKVLIP